MYKRLYTIELELSDSSMIDDTNLALSYPAVATTFDCLKEPTVNWLLPLVHHVGSANRMAALWFLKPHSHIGKFPRLSTKATFRFLLVFPISSGSCHEARRHEVIVSSMCVSKLRMFHQSGDRSS